MTVAAKLVGRIERFMLDPSADDFDSLARAAFALQYGRLAAVRRLAAARGVTPEELNDWRQIPTMPVLAFKSTELAVAPAVEVFRSSGTTGGPRSHHHHPFPDLYRRTIDLSFPGACLPRDASGRPRERLPILSLVPSRAQAADSSLGFMAAHVVDRWGDERSRNAFGEAGVEVTAATRWGAAREGGDPVLVFATAFALVQWLESLEAEARRLSLPAGSVVFETGGFKGRVREIRREELLARVGERLGVPAGQVVREYGMSEMTSQLYSSVLRGGSGEHFVAPHWLRYRLLDPVSFDAVAAGEAGMISILDLANVGSAIHLLSEDLGIGEPEGLRLLGRASGAEVRGCSLTVEEMRGQR